MYHANAEWVLMAVHPSPAPLAGSRQSFPSRLRVLDEAYRAGVRILAMAGVGAIGLLPFVVTALVRG